MPRRLSIEDLRRDLEWKRTYLCELEKKHRRLESALADTRAEITARRKEVAELQRQFDSYSGNSG